jgi:hypothetical protein
MTERDEDLIKKRAYALWEAEGRPEGRHDSHWEQAFRELSNGDDTAVQGEPESNAPPVDVAPSRPKTTAAKSSAPPLSVLEGGAAGNPGAKRKKKTV